jgi:hypothetical protein
MAFGTTRYAARGAARNLAHATDDGIGLQPLPPGVALLLIAASSAGLWYGIYRLGNWLF